jgi:hypothetical protein
MADRYDIRAECEITWTVYDVETDSPALVEGTETVGLNMQDADELAERLNARHRQSAPVQSPAFAAAS